MTLREIWSRHRWKSILGVILVHVAVGYALLVGLNIDVVREVGKTLQLVELNEMTLNPPPPESQVNPDPLEEGGAAPPNEESQASPVVAPEPPVVIPRPQPVTAAPEPNRGADRSQGAADPGPGTGAGGEGTGTGRGAGGGGPGGGALASRARRISGTISDRDYPREALRVCAQGRVGANVDVSADGRVTGCRIAQSSGNAALDATTCRLIRERFVYEPARNARSEPVPDRVGRYQDWTLGPNCTPR